MKVAPSVQRNPAIPRPAERGRTALKKVTECRHRSRLLDRRLFDREASKEIQSDPRFAGASLLFATRHSEEAHPAPARSLPQVPEPCFRSPDGFGSPSATPGRIAFTRIFFEPSSMARVFVKPTAAHFDAEYGARRGKPKRPAADDKLMMDGLLLPDRYFTARRAQLNWPVIFGRGRGCRRAGCVR